MRLKTALVMSVVVNAVFVAVFGYLLATEIEVHNDPIIVIYPKSTAMQGGLTAALEPQN